MENLFTSIEQKIEEAKGKHHLKIQEMEKEITRDLENLKSNYKQQIKNTEISFKQEVIQLKDNFQPIWQIFTVGVIFLVGVATTLLILHWIATPDLEKITTKEGTFYKIPKEKLIEADWDQNFYYLQKE